MTFDLKLNEGFSKRELKLLNRVGLAASAHTTRASYPTETHVYLYDPKAKFSDELIAVGVSSFRREALQNALKIAKALPRCPCGGRTTERWRTCVQCGALLRAAQYDDWIRSWISRHRIIVGACSRATLEMVEVFPELKRTAGWVSGNETLLTEHWWCVTPDGSIVDPTASQFSGELTYRAFAPGDEVRVGRCVYCGIGIYAKVERLDDPSYRRSVCGRECQRELEAELREEERTT